MVRPFPKGDWNGIGTKFISHSEIHWIGRRQGNSLMGLLREELEELGDYQDWRFWEWDPIFYFSYHLAGWGASHLSFGKDPKF